jgi:hypothetical protein
LRSRNVEPPNHSRSQPSAVGQLGINVDKVIASSKDPVKACLGFLEMHPVDLIVLAVHQHEGRMRWLEKSVGKPIARGARQMTLFINESTSPWGTHTALPVGSDYESCSQEGEAVSSRA